MPSRAERNFVWSVHQQVILLLKTIRTGFRVKSFTVYTSRVPVLESDNCDLYHLKSTFAYVVVMYGGNHEWLVTSHMARDINSAADQIVKNHAR